MGETGIAGALGILAVLAVFVGGLWWLLHRNGKDTESKTPSGGGGSTDKPPIRRR